MSLQIHTEAARRALAGLALGTAVVLGACTGDEARFVGVELCAQTEATDDSYDVVGDFLQSQPGLADAFIAQRPRLVWLWRSLTRTEVASKTVAAPLDASTPVCTRVDPPSKSMAATFSLAVSGRFELAGGPPGVLPFASRGYTPWVVLFDDVDGDEAFTPGTDPVMSWAHARGGSYATGVFWLPNFAAALGDPMFKQALVAAMPHPSSPFFSTQQGQIDARWRPKALDLSQIVPLCDHVIARPECASLGLDDDPTFYPRTVLAISDAFAERLSGLPDYAEIIDYAQLYGEIGQLTDEPPDWLRRASEATLDGRVVVECAQYGPLDVLHVAMLTEYGRFSESGAFEDLESDWVTLSVEQASDPQFETVFARNCACERSQFSGFAVSPRDLLPGWWPCAEPSPEAVAAAIAATEPYLPGSLLTQLVEDAADGVLGSSGEGPDGGVPDGGMPDGGVPDGGVPDGGVPDGGVPDGGVPDGGVPDGGDEVRDMSRDLSPDVQP